MRAPARGFLAAISRLLPQEILAAPFGELAEGIHHKSASRQYSYVTQSRALALHGYPWLIHRLTYRRTNHRNLHVRGYKEKGNINTPLDLAIQNQIGRFSLAMDVIDRLPRLHVAGAHAKERLRNMQIECQNYAYEHGVDKPEIDQWRWSLE